MPPGMVSGQGGAVGKGEATNPKKVNVERVSPRRARVHDQKLQQMKQN